MRFGRQLQVVELIAVHGRGAQGPHLAALHEFVQGLHRFFHRRIIVKPVNLIQIQVIGLQTFQRAVNFPQDGLTGQFPFVEIDFRGQHHVFPAHPEMFQCLPDIFFTGTAGILVCRINKVHPEIQGMGNHGLGIGLVQGPLMIFFGRLAE